MKKLLIVLAIAMVASALGCAEMQGPPNRQNQNGQPGMMPADSTHLGSLYMQAMALIQENKINEAEEVLNTAIRIGGQNYMSYVMRAEVRLRGAANDFNHASMMMPGDPYATKMMMETVQTLNATHGKEIYQKAVICKMNGDLKGAIDCYTMLLQFNPANPWVLFERGNLLGMAGDWASATKDYEEVLKLVPEHQYAKMFLDVAKGHTEGTFKDMMKMPPQEQPAPAPKEEPKK